MTGIPSIVAGLFAYALFALIFGPGIRIGFVGSVALSVLMIPVVVRSSEEMLRLVPNELREASYALGVPKWLTIAEGRAAHLHRRHHDRRHALDPRVIGETAPLLSSPGFTTSMNYNLFNEPHDDAARVRLHPVREPGHPTRRPTSTAPGPARSPSSSSSCCSTSIARLVAKIFAPKSGR